MASGTVVEPDLAGPALSLTDGDEERLLDSDREDNTAQSVSFLLFAIYYEFILSHRHYFLYVTRKFLYSYPYHSFHFLKNPVNLRRTGSHFLNSKFIAFPLKIDLSYLSYFLHFL